VGFFLVGWDPRVALLLVGIANPLVDEGKGIF